jgi:ABC-type sulfate/molybdate transport systems ATPase subunit
MAPASTRFMGVRAHHIAFPDAQTHESANGGNARSDENVIPCWLAHTSETPFRMTVFLRTRELETSEDEIELQAELTKSDWDRLRVLEQPWRARLAPENLFAMDS